MRIQGSTVLLTGATGGIGHAIARALGARGASLILTGRRTEVLGPLAEELRARSIAVDLTSAEEVDRLVAEAGPVDILIANAALPGSGMLADLSVVDIDRALAVNLRAPIVLTRALSPAMVSRRSGHLLYISSLAGKVSAPGASIYNATKFGLRGFASAMRTELRSSGVGVSSIFPGFISDAGMFADTGLDLPAGVGTRTPEEVAEAVVSAIERNRGEVDVAPLPLRAGARLAGFAPELSHTLTRKLGGEEIARKMAAAQTDKR